MKAIRNLATLAAVATMFATFGASWASAQTAAQGNIKLPFQARWGSANLPPGSYHFDVQSSGNTNRVVKVWSQNKEIGPVVILGVVDQNASPNGANALICMRHSSTCVVRTLELGIADETLTFAAPKIEPIEREARARKNHVQERQTVAAIETVPVTISGK